MTTKEKVEYLEKQVEEAKNGELLWVVREVDPLVDCTGEVVMETITITFQFVTER